MLMLNILLYFRPLAGIDYGENSIAVRKSNTKTPLPQARRGLRMYFVQVHTAIIVSMLQKLAQL